MVEAHDSSFVDRCAKPLEESRTRRASPRIWKRETAGHVATTARRRRRLHPRNCQTSVRYRAAPGCLLVPGVQERAFNRPGRDVRTACRPEYYICLGARATLRAGVHEGRCDAVSQLSIRREEAGSATWQSTQRDTVPIRSACCEETAAQQNNRRLQKIGAGQRFAIDVPQRPWFNSGRERFAFSSVTNREGVRCRELRTPTLNRACCPYRKLSEILELRA
jgi:hypothetical protein